MRLPELPDLSVLAFDPGRNSGVAHYANGEITAYNWKEEQFFEYLNHPTLLNTEVYVVEEFRLYPSMAMTLSNNRMETSELIGVIRANAFLRDIPVVFQSAANAKKLCTDALLKQYGWYGYGKNDHQRDAIRHLLYYLIRQATKK